MTDKWPAKALRNYAQGYLEGRLEVQLSMFARLTCESLRSKCGEIPYVLRKRIQYEKDPDELYSWAEIAMECSSLEEFCEKGGLTRFLDQ